MKIGVGFPAQIPGMSRDEFLGFTHHAERHGFHSLWVLDRLVYDSMAPLPLLAAAASISNRILLGTSILLATQHSPLVLAKELATIDRISGGRLIVGMAAGGRQMDFEAAAIPIRNRGRRLEETIDLLKLAWSGGSINYHGRIFSIEVPPVGPSPIQKHYPQICLGGRSEAAIERAVRIADGYIPGGSGPTALRHQLEQVRQAAEKLGRDYKAVTCAAVTYFALGLSTDRALEKVTNYLRTYYGPDLKLNPPKDVVYGPPRLAGERLREFAETRIDTLILVPTIRDPEQVNLLAEALELATLLPSGAAA